MPFSKPQLESDTTIRDFKIKRSLYTQVAVLSCWNIESFFMMDVCKCLLLSIYSMHFALPLFNQTWNFLFYDIFLNIFCWSKKTFWMTLTNICSRFMLHFQILFLHFKNIFQLFAKLRPSMYFNVEMIFNFKVNLILICTGERWKKMWMSITINAHNNTSHNFCHYYNIRFNN